MVFFGITVFCLTLCNTHTANSPCFIFCLNVSHKTWMSNSECHISATFSMKTHFSSSKSVCLRSRRSRVRIATGIPFFLLVLRVISSLAGVAPAVTYAGMLLWLLLAKLEISTQSFAKNGLKNQLIATDVIFCFCKKSPKIPPCSHNCSHNSIECIVPANDFCTK